MNAVCSSNVVEPTCSWGLQQHAAALHAVGYSQVGERFPTDETKPNSKGRALL